MEGKEYHLGVGAALAAAALAAAFAARSALRKCLRSSLVTCNPLEQNLADLSLVLGQGLPFIKSGQGLNCDLGRCSLCLLCADASRLSLRLLRLVFRLPSLDGVLGLCDPERCEGVRGPELGAGESLLRPPPSPLLSDLPRLAGPSRLAFLSLTGV